MRINFQGAKGGLHTRTKPATPCKSQCSVSQWWPQPGSCRLPQLAPGTANPGLLSRDSRPAPSAVHTALMKVLSLPFPVSSDPDRLTLLPLRMLIFPLSTISKPKQHLDLQLAIQRETDYNWKKLHISFPSFMFLLLSELPTYDFQNSFTGRRTESFIETPKHNIRPLPFQNNLK